MFYISEAHDPEAHIPQAHRCRSNCESCTRTRVERHDLFPSSEADQESRHRQLKNCLYTDLPCHQYVTVDAVCDICGNGEEDEHHAVIGCTKSRALRGAMRDTWDLPPERAFRYTGSDWLQVLVDTLCDDMRTKVLFLLWMCWHLHDDCTHGNGRELNSNSVQFLSRYEEEWNSAFEDQATDRSNPGHILSNPLPSMRPERCMQWSAPAKGMVKLNSDAVFHADGGNSWACLPVHLQRNVSIIKCGRSRRSERSSSWQCIVYRGGPMELQVNCKWLADALKKDAANRSDCYGLISDLHAALAAFSAVKVSHVSWDCNKLAHELAVEARTKGGQTIFANVPDRLKQLMLSECAQSLE